ncbi:DUF177 domain-containing protein [Candidatus Omnitrophota bacterium]
MKIDPLLIGAEGLSLNEAIDPGQLDLGNEVAKFEGPVKASGKALLFANVLTVELKICGLMRAECSRCLKELEVPVSNKLRLDYQVVESPQAIDLDPQIREEIILNLPIKPLCNSGCKGLCPGCGRDLNQGSCDCNNKE